MNTEEVSIDITDISTNSTDCNMNFIKFSSIESDTNEKQLDRTTRLFSQYEYIVMEKIHGANFQFICQVKNQDSLDICCAKRSAILLDNENFYGWKDMLNRYTGELYILYQNIVKNQNIIKNQNLIGFRVYGELYGGVYPHRDVKRVKNASTVQKGIYYNPDNDFILFDISIRVQESGERFLSYDEVVEVCSTLKHLKYVPVMFRGTLQECVNRCRSDLKFITTIPKMFNLPVIDKNYAEGYVIKPNISTNHGHDRGLLKIKNPDFLETINFVPKMNNIDRDEENKKRKVVSEYSDKLRCYLTQNRLDNVISKIGPSSVKPKIVGCFIADAKEDFVKVEFSEHLDPAHYHPVDQTCPFMEFNEVWKDIRVSLTTYCTQNFVYP